MTNKYKPQQGHNISRAINDAITVAPVLLCFNGMEFNVTETSTHDELLKEFYVKKDDTQAIVDLYTA